MTPIRPVLSYYLFSARKGGQHDDNPFICHLIRDVFYDKKRYDDYNLICEARKKYFRSKEKIRVTDLGTGSRQGKTEYIKRVRTIAKRSSERPKYHYLLYRLVKHFGPSVMLEAGTSLGLGTMALALGHPAGHVFTIEGDPASVTLAKHLFKEQNLSNIELMTGAFRKMFPKVFSKTNLIDFVFLDGHHEEKATMEYFVTLLPRLHNKSIFVFDDIHWSMGMQRAWNTLQKHPQVSLCIDIFRMGLVFFDPILPKRTLTVRF